MKISFIVVIDPVKGIHHLNILIHAMNLQTSNAFDVIFYNQTALEEDQIFASLTVAPRFSYRFHSIDQEFLFGGYPVWDLYGFHSYLLKEDLVQDYLMCLHMEEFPDPDYVKNAIEVLGKHDLDILFGNLCRTKHFYKDVAGALECESARDLRRFLKVTGIAGSPHWAFKPNRDTARQKRRLFNLKLDRHLDYRSHGQLRPNRRGYSRLAKCEDLYFMKKSFARKYNWFLEGHSMYFEDIHLCNKKGVCELVPEIQRLTKYPLYFNLSCMYHIEHGKYYYQLENQDFAREFLKYETDDVILKTLRRAIIRYQSGELNLKDALTYTRRNDQGTGTQNLNYVYHMRYLREAHSSG